MTMKLLHSCFLALCNGAAVSAWYDAFVGDSFNSITPLRRWYNISDARQSPNFTTSISFPTGPSLTVQYWNLTVSLAEVLAQGENATVVPDARILFTFYDLHPPGNWTDNLDSGLPMPIVNDDEDEPVTFQLASRLTYWPFSASATNAYNGQGNCAEVVDLECMRQLETNDTAIFGDTPACPSVASRWGDTGVGTYAQHGQKCLRKYQPLEIMLTIFVHGCSAIRATSQPQRLQLVPAWGFHLGRLFRRQPHAHRARAEPRPPRCCGGY